MYIVRTPKGPIKNMYVEIPRVHTHTHTPYAGFNGNRKHC